MTKRNIHTVYSKDRDMWETKLEHRDKPLASSHTKEVAMEKSVREAKKLEVEHVIHNRDGKISDKDSYGNDPVKSKDTVY